MKKNGILILLYFAVSVSNSSDAYFYADTNSIAPIAYYAEDSLPTRIGHVNPISTLAAISTITIPIIVQIGRRFGFYAGPLVLTLIILGFIGGVIGLVVRKKLMNGKYANYPKPKKLPLGQGRSWIGMLGFIILLVVGVIFFSYYIL